MQALANDLAWQDARISLRSWSVESNEGHPLSWGDRRVRGRVVGGRPLTRTPKCFVLSPNFLPSCFAESVTVPELRIEHILKLPVIQDQGVGRVVKETSGPK